jgi:hypothetical protein
MSLLLKGKYFRYTTISNFSQLLFLVLNLKNSDLSQDWRERLGNRSMDCSRNSKRLSLIILNARNFHPTLSLGDNSSDITIVTAAYVLEIL